MSAALDLVIRGATVVLPSGCERLDVGVEGGRIAVARARHRGARRGGVRRRGTARPPRLRRCARPLQRARPHRVGGLGHRHACARRRRRHHFARDAAERAPADHRRPRPSTRKLAALEAGPRSSTSRSGAASCPATSAGWRSWPSAASSASRRSCARAGSTTSRRADDATLARRDARGGAARAARGGARRERASSLGWLPTRAPRGDGVRDYLASRPVVAELEAIEPRAPARRRDGLRAARRPRVSTGRGVAARRRGAGARRGRDLRDLPALPVLDEDDLERLGARRPSARRRCARADEREALWARARDGTVDLVASRPLAVARRS